jgi:hypothetical protein
MPMAKTSIDQLEGGDALCAWFGGVPSFHDATLRFAKARRDCLSLKLSKWNLRSMLKAISF